jgi:hypothetical protein
MPAEQTTRIPVNLSKIARNLFDAPKSSERLKTLVEENAKFERKQMEKLTTTYNFDFESCTPKTGPYKWEKI